MKKIYITGCAKTGTTVLLRLFYAFKDCDVLYKTGFNGHEVSFEDFVKQRSYKKFLVGKRLPPFLLSTADGDHDKQLELIKKHDIGIINVVRDPRDVLLSDGFYVKPDRWISCDKQREKFNDIIDFEVSYEDIMRMPNAVQKDIADTFGLEFEDGFSNYPDFVPAHAFNWDVSHVNRNNNAPPEQASDYSKRRLSIKAIGKDIEKYKEICTKPEIDYIDNYLKDNIMVHYDD